ncbi:MAG: hypothetical protein C0523_03440, partial [Cytophaga sp.]|nr:hypothetical protein [Cytophaga sp.]
MKTARKVIVYVALTLLVVVVALTTSVFLFKDRIIQQFIREANKSLNTPIKIGKIEVSAWQDFPNLSIVFTDVYVEDSHQGTYPLLTAKTISFSLNTYEVYQGKYSIRGLKVVDSETNLKINAVGVSNYVITKTTGKGGGGITLDLKNVQLKNTKVRYLDQLIHQHHVFSSDELTASIGVENEVYRIEATGDLTTDQIGIREKIFLNQKRFDVNARLDYDDANNSIVIKPSKLAINKSVFDVRGTYRFNDKNEIDLITEAKDADIQT